MVKRAHLAPGEAQWRRIFIRGPRGRPCLTFELLPRRSPWWDTAGRFAHIVTCVAHLGPGKPLAATPTAFHPRPSWAADEIELSGPVETSLHEPSSDTCHIAPTHNDCSKAERGGSAAQRQRPHAAQTDRHVSGAGRTARAIEEPVFGRGSAKIAPAAPVGVRAWHSGSSLAGPRGQRLPAASRMP